MYTKDLTDILDEVVTGMSFPVMVDSVVVNVDGTQTITACNIYHAQKGYYVTINSIPYIIVGFSYNPDTLILSGSGTIVVGDTFNLYPVFFFHGTPIETTVELSKVMNASDKTPMIWLWENFEENIPDDYSPVVRMVELDLYFLTQADHETLETQDMYDNYIKPMKRLAENFKAAIKLDTVNFDADHLPMKTTNWTKFGVYARGKGMTKNIMIDKLSGVSAKASLKLFNKDSCDCPESPTTNCYPATLYDANGNIVAIIPSDGSYTLPANSTVLNFIFGIGATADYTQTIVSGEEGIYTSESLTNINSVVYKKNAVVSPLPITLAIGDTLQVTGTITDIGLAAIVKLIGTY